LSRFSVAQGARRKRRKSVRGAHDQELATFTAAYLFHGKGPLSVALVVTHHAKKMGFPLDGEKLLTEGGGQVLGLGKATVQAILKRHGIERVLASEGGRTSRGSLSNMREYVAFLNALEENGRVDLDAVEEFWIQRVHEFFAGKPFKIKLDASRSLRMVVRDVIGQAVERQKTAPTLAPCFSTWWERSSTVRSARESSNTTVFRPLTLPAGELEIF
jgi:hypothetical protein